ncbi:hypothetical protein [Bacillus taeanensis]|uniref:hypothetical protein n=1 Tax=Bacillus taeanensis TaxID=273032 RepID=UPI001FE2E252|nr:hypothetical protein [Bacillus taeanensis]
MLKRKKLRHNEYYDMQHRLDNLYAQSVNGQNFYNLMKWIRSDENIRLAYRNIKRNTGSKTAGTDKLTIEDVKCLSVEEVILKVQNMLQNAWTMQLDQAFLFLGISIMSTVDLK